MICLMHSVAKTRPTVFHLTLHQKEKNYSDMLPFWISSFQVPVLPVLFTERDIAMNAAISAMSYSNPCTVLMYVFHLFDMNVKKTVFPVLTASGKGYSS